MEGRTARYVLFVAAMSFGYINVGAQRLPIPPEVATVIDSFKSACSSAKLNGVILGQAIDLIPHNATFREGLLSSISSCYMDVLYRSILRTIRRPMVPNFGRCVDYSYEEAINSHRYQYVHPKRKLFTRTHNAIKILTTVRSDIQRYFNATNFLNQMENIVYANDPDGLNGATLGKLLDSIPADGYMKNRITSTLTGCFIDFKVVGTNNTVEEFADCAINEVKRDSAYASKMETESEDSDEIAACRTLPIIKPNRPSTKC